MVFSVGHDTNNTGSNNSFPFYGFKACFCTPNRTQKNFSNYIGPKEKYGGVFLKKEKEANKEERAFQKGPNMPLQKTLF